MNQQKTKHTDSGKENTGLSQKFCFQGRAIPVNSTCQKTHNVGFKNQSLIGDNNYASAISAV